MERPPRPASCPVCPGNELFMPSCVRKAKAMPAVRRIKKGQNGRGNQDKAMPTVLWERRDALGFMVQMPQGHTPAQMPQPMQRASSET